jgi:AraC-like DNA-binding protein
MPECDIRLLRIPAVECDSRCNHDDAQLVFGDSTLLKQLRWQSKQTGKACSLASAKFIWLTAGDEPVAQAAEAAGEIAAHLPIECPAEELFAIVRRLIGFGGPAANREPSPEHRVRAKVCGGLAPGALRRVREYIDQHLTESVRTEVLARIAALSPGHFNRAFKQSTGISPHRYILQKRVAFATELLRETTRALADIALDVGFADQSHFCRTFASISGETPSACRRRFR